MKEFTICDYKGNEKIVKLDLSKIRVIMKYVFSDDETLEVFYKNGDKHWINSLGIVTTDIGILDIFDDSELVYSSDMEV